MSSQRKPRSARTNSTDCSSLDLIYRAQAAVVIRAYEDNDLELLNSLCNAALKSSRLPIEYRTMYQSILDSAATTPMTKDHTVKAEEIVAFVLGSMQGEGANQEENAEELQDVIDRAKILKELTTEEKELEKERMFQSLARMREEEIAREGAGGGQTGHAKRTRMRSSSH